MIEQDPKNEYMSEVFDKAMRARAYVRSADATLHKS
jgi:hypothetical protein